VVHFGGCVPVLGSLEWVGKDGQATTLALLQAQVQNQGDAWVHFVEQLVRLLDEHEGAASGTAATQASEATVQRLERLAQRIAELHVALGQRSGNPDFDPEPVTTADQRGWVDAVAAELQASMALLERHAATAGAHPLAAPVLAARDALRARIERAARAAPAGAKTRIHGDLHLQQILVCRDDFVIIDFEGEPSRPIAERRARSSPMRDVAGMLRSFDYARESALQAAAAGAVQREQLGPAARHWERRAREAFLDAYWSAAVAGGLYEAGQRDDLLAVLDLFEIGKALYELRYEIDNRPDWIGVPLAGLAALAAPQDTPGESGRT